MKRSVFPPTPDIPDSTVGDLHALYREGADAEPGPQLDQRILDAARAEIQADNSVKARRHAPWWKGWLVPATSIAVAVLGVSLGWHVMDEQERELRRTVDAVESAPDVANPATKKVAPAESATMAQPPDNAPASKEKSQRLEAKAVQGSPAAVTAPAVEPQAFPVQQEAARNGAAAGSVARAVPAPVTAAPAAMAAPVPTTETLKKRAEASELREKRDATQTASGRAAVPGKAEAGSAEEAATPEAWLKTIRDLRAAGRNAEAVQSLARFRVRYPDFVLPDDLNGLK
jgi:hypothetical protein